jgi:hypothetical protein
MAGVPLASQALGAALDTTGTTSTTSGGANCTIGVAVTNAVVTSSGDTLLANFDIADGCQHVHVWLVVYLTGSASFVLPQQLFASSDGQFGSGDKGQLHAKTPSCAYQWDLVVRDQPPPQTLTQDNLFGNQKAAAGNAGEGSCHTTTTTTTTTSTPGTTQTVTSTVTNTVTTPPPAAQTVTNTVTTPPPAAQTVTNTVTTPPPPAQTVTNTVTTTLPGKVVHKTIVKVIHKTIVKPAIPKHPKPAYTK